MRQLYIKFILLIVFQATITSNTFAATIHLNNFPAQGAYIDTLRLQLLDTSDPEFYSDGEIRKVKILPEENTAFYYKTWIHEKPAPIVFVLPGLGGHYAGAIQTALAEIIYNAGFSVVLITSPFSWDFVLNASTVVTPGYTPFDTQDTYTVIQAILKDLESEYGTNMFTEKILTGYSLGGLQTLFISQIDSEKKSVGFDRYVAVSPPVNLLNALKQLDNLYNVWTPWNDDKTNKKITDLTTYYKKFVENNMTNDAPLNVTSEDAKLAIGVVYRRVLTETIKAILKKRNFNFISNEYGFTTEDLDKEIERFSYYNYLKTFFKTTQSNLWTKDFSLRKLNAAAGIPAIQESISGNTNIFVFHATNDFLLTDYDRNWLADVLGNRLCFFDCGGHLGYLYRNDFHALFLKTLNGESICLTNDNYITGINNQEKILAQHEIELISTSNVNNIAVTVTEDHTIDLPPGTTASIVRITIKPEQKEKKKKKDRRNDITLESSDNGL